MTFSRHPKASKYFVLCTVTLSDLSFGDRLLELRRQLAWEGVPLRDYFHASVDKQAVRTAVYDIVASAPMQVCATILEKSKAQPQVRYSPERFYHYAWYFHLSGIYSRLGGAGDEILFTTASIGTRKGQGAFAAAVNDVIQQCVKGAKARTFFCSAASDPCLQIADYCAWAIQRKWEQGDTRAFDRIRAHVVHENDAWKRGDVHYY